MYKEMPFTEWEQSKIDRMLENGGTLEGAIKARYALRRKNKVQQVKPKKDVVIQA